MTKVKIIGAGSIGNHLAYACTNMGWDVAVVDIDPEALRRMKEEIYPARYGGWNDKISFLDVDNAHDNDYDLVVVGTPPDTHMDLAINEIEKSNPKVILIEKPLCTPELERVNELKELADSKGVKLCVAYNHVTTENTKIVEQLIGNRELGKPCSINIQWLEHWGGIFNAHPWLAGPHDSYLGFSSRGGGATGEHSHCVSLCLHFLEKMGLNGNYHINATMDFVSEDQGVDYDSNATITLKSKDIMCTIQTDVLTAPARKFMRIQWERGHAEWYVNYDSGHDAVKYQIGNNDQITKLIPKSRPDDFQNEVVHLGELISGNSDYSTSPVRFAKGLETMQVVQSAYASAKDNKVLQCTLGDK